MPGRTLIAVTDKDGSIRQLNEHCEAVLGVRTDEVLGRPIWSLLPGAEQAEMMRAGLLRCAAGESVDDCRGQWQTHSGSQFAVQWGYCPLFGSDQQILAVVVAGADLRRSIRMQAELTEAVDLHQAILDTAVDGIIAIGEDGVVRSFNRAAERIFGYRAVEVLGHNISMLMPQPYRGEHDGYIHNYLVTHRKKIIGIGREVEGLRKDGTVFPLELAVGEVVVSGPRVFTGIIRDISDRKAAELEARRRHDELAHLTRMHSMGDLAAGLAHEINQPLTAILSHSRACVRMIDAGTADMALLHESMAQIGRQAERAAEVIRRLRRYVEKGENETQPSDLGASVREVLSLLQHELKMHEVKVVDRSTAGLPELMLDRIQIEQVLVNLIRNAIEAMVEAGVDEPQLELDAALSDAPAGVRLRLRDNGPGFGATAPDQLFAPFFSTKKQGMGQGLSICRRIVESHGGRIWADANEGGGAAFYLWLPLPPRDNQDRHSSEPSHQVS